MCMIELTAKTATAASRMGSQSEAIEIISPPLRCRCSLKSLVVTDGGSQPLVALLVQFSLNAPLPGSPGRAGGAAGLRHDQGARDQVLEPAQGLAPVALLGAVIARRDQDLARVDQAMAGERAQAELGALVEKAACSQVEAQLRGGRHLVDVLAPRAGAAHETQGILAVGNMHGGAQRSLPSPSRRTSCCVTGIVMPWSRNRRQMRRLTSERTLLTPFCGSAIQKRSSRSMPWSENWIRRVTGAGSFRTRRLPSTAPSSSCRATSGSSRDLMRTGSLRR